MPDSKRFGLIASHDDYLIKLYRKLNELLRYEIKLKSKQKLNEAGINSLADLNERNVNNLANELVKQWGEIITRDGLNVYDRFDVLTSKEREKILEFTSLVYIQSYHEKLREASSQTERDKLRQEAYRLKKYCLNLIRKHGNDDHSKLYKLIFEGVESFKQTWKVKRGVSRFPSLMKPGNRDKGNTEIENSNYKINTGMEKSKKQLSKEKREAKSLIYKSFLNKLKEIEPGKATVSKNGVKP
jgi:hypothetical protein